MAGAGFYLTRLAMKNPEVTWHPKKNQEPWEAYKEKTYKVSMFILLTYVNISVFFFLSYNVIYGFT